MKIVYTVAARNDFDAVATYLQSTNSYALANVADDILSAIERLTEFPFCGRRQDSPGVRKIVTRRYRYRIFYLVEEEAAVVTILSILHPARQS